MASPFINTKYNRKIHKLTIAASVAPLVPAMLTLPADVPAPE